MLALALAALAALDARSVAVGDLRGVRGLVTPCEHRAIAAVRAASPPAKRNALIATRFEGELLLWYGDPRHPDGREPFGADGSRGYINGKPVGTQTSYHVIGHGCNEYFDAGARELFAATEGACADFHETRADVVAREYARCALSPQGAP